MDKRKIKRLIIIGVVLSMLTWIFVREYKRKLRSQRVHHDFDANMDQILYFDAKMNQFLYPQNSIVTHTGQTK